MWLFGIIGIISLILSFLYFFGPEAVKKIDKVGKQFVLTTEKLLEKRKIVGLFYLIAGIALICIAFWR